MNDENKKLPENKEYESVINVDICFLLDFYGQLLTQKTREILELHYAEDMSLAEISDQFGITRQAVHDTIKRGVATLQEYEEKLNLVNRFNLQKKCIQQAISDIENGEPKAAKEKLTQLTQLL